MFLALCTVIGIMVESTIIEGRKRAVVAITLSQLIDLV